MSAKFPKRTEEARTIGGFDVLVNTDPGEIFIDLPASNPRYIRVREGDRIQEGDVSSRRSAELSGPLLTHWVVDSITIDTVTGTDTKTGETREWERDKLVQRLTVGEFSAELTTFDRVSVTEIEGLPGSASEESKWRNPYVIIVVYGNNGKKFTEVHAATVPGDWDSLEVVQRDSNVQHFSDDLRERFEGAIQRALQLEMHF
ncbi:hypothetical protein ACFQJC_09710 [Haloferax namakaokahaiae]|uniref:Uncharacterized protein n=1 Tax=Haloferax namakaokahaiae TaxID=1748331 RepID=A0ABD5ZEY3_9EURY